MKNKLLGVMCTLVLLPMNGMAVSSQKMKLFGKPYRPVVQASVDQVQVVYYRAGSPATQSTGPSAHLYIDGEFHTGLLPGGYTVFCVKPGTHKLGVHYQEGPQFSGKRSVQGLVDMEAGKTYFLEAGNVDASGQLIPVNLKDGEKELADNLEQAHVVSRASTVVPCANRLGGYVVTGDNSHGLVYALPLDILFEFNRSDRDGITVDGRQALDRLSAELEGNPAADLLVTGHADVIGSDATAEALGRARAETVRAILLEAGALNVEARSAGNREPLNRECGNTRNSSSVKCNAVNRRVRIELR